MLLFTLPMVVPNLKTDKMQLYVISSNWIICLLDKYSFGV